MPHDTRQMRTEPAAVLFPWGSPQSEIGEFATGAAVAAWLGGASGVLGLWTVLALLLTSA